MVHHSCTFGPAPTPDLHLAISNQTTLPVTLVVNGRVIGNFGAGEAQDPIEPSRLPPPPWMIEIETASGRALLSLQVQTPGSRAVPGGGVVGSGQRVYLSCGRLEVWSGPPLLGPGGRPPSYPPGDCAP